MAGVGRDQQFFDDVAVRRGRIDPVAARAGFEQQVDLVALDLDPGFDVVEIDEVDETRGAELGRGALERQPPTMPTLNFSGLSSVKA